MEKKHELKFFAKGKMKGLVIAFVWIMLWNLIYQVAHGTRHALPIANRAFLSA